MDRPFLSRYRIGDAGECCYRPFRPAVGKTILFPDRRENTTRTTSAIFEVRDNGMNDTTIHQLGAAPAGILRLVQITDCHIFADAESRLLGIDTRASLRAVCGAIEREQPQRDGILATGDLSQDGLPESYAYLAQQLETLGAPVFWLPGNHDVIETMSRCFRGGRIQAARRVLGAGWQIVLLDSTLPGEVHGEVSADELDFLDAALGEYPDRHALVCLHHQAIDTGSRWIDLKGLRRQDELGARIRGHANVRGVLWGHVHQEAHHRLDGIDWMSTPSSCVQFKPGSEVFATDTAAPGYRSLALHADGRIETAVHRLQDFEFESANGVRGY